MDKLAKHWGYSLMKPFFLYLIVWKKKPKTHSRSWRGSVCPLIGGTLADGVVRAAVRVFRWEVTPMIPPSVGKTKCFLLPCKQLVWPDGLPPIKDDDLFHSVTLNFCRHAHTRARALSLWLCPLRSQTKDRESQVVLIRQMLPVFFTTRVRLTDKIYFF